MSQSRQWLPAIVTMIALASGLAAIEAAREGNWELALRLILVAAVADGVDGRLARHLRATSSMGEQFDSLSDIVAFGVAPSFLFVAVFADAPPLLRYGVGFLFVLAAAYRLARFHAEPSNGIFCGLPITAAGPLLAVVVAGPLYVTSWVAAMIGLTLAALMVSRFPFPKPSKPRSRTITVASVAGIAVPILVWPRVETVAVLAGVILIGYIVGSMLAAIIGDQIEAVGVEEVADARERAH